MPKSKLPAIAVVGDLHANSTTGLFPSSYLRVSGNVVLGNPEQRWLWDCWLQYCDWLDQFQIEAIVLNGDVPQGINARDVQLISSNEADQDNIAYAVLEPLLYKKNKRRTENIYVTRGTGFHSGGEGSREERIARGIGAVKDGNGAYSRFVNLLEWRGKRLQFIHHISHASVYPLTPLYKAQQNARLKEQITGVRMPDVDIRSHVHVSHAYEAADNKWIATAPAWQLATEFAHKVAPGSDPSIGGLVICLDEETNRVKVERLLFPLLKPSPLIIPTLTPSLKRLKPSNLSARRMEKR